MKYTKKYLTYPMKEYVVQELSRCTINVMKSFVYRTTESYTLAIKFPGMIDICGGNLNDTVFHFIERLRRWILETTSVTIDFDTSRLADVIPDAPENNYYSTLYNGYKHTMQAANYLSSLDKDDWSKSLKIFIAINGKGVHDWTVAVHKLIKNDDGTFNRTINIFDFMKAIGILNQVGDKYEFTYTMSGDDPVYVTDTLKQSLKMDPTALFNYVYENAVIREDEEALGIIYNRMNNGGHIFGYDLEAVRVGATAVHLYYYEYRELEAHIVFHYSYLNGRLQINTVCACTKNLK